ncbi:Catalase/peroxidase HPI [Phytophthora cinnamomi]|uniref:Catalase/peroxidase HPI n=1 Tax=Phytophthora cinnamomi TaxID=4785 RepID=UPI00355AB760|nr:Catalase/peroxidase HPI [Phytophthora cinnamomi]
MTMISVRNNIKILGVSPREVMALAGHPRSVAQRGPRYPSEKEYKAEGKDVYMMDTDLALLVVPELKETVQLFTSVEGVVKHVFSSA